MNSTPAETCLLPAICGFAAIAFSVEFAENIPLISALSTTGRLFGLFWPLTIEKSHPRPATILVDEFDAGHFHGASNRQVISSRHGRLTAG
jgi:hypothetical protein